MVFLNLSNHPIDKWEHEQLMAAKKLGLGEPTELKGGMPLIAAKASEEAIDALAEKIVAQSMEQHTVGAFVASDFTFTFALVSKLLKKMYAVMPQRLQEIQPTT